MSAIADLGSLSRSASRPASPATTLPLSPRVSASRRARWAGRVVSALPVLFLAFDAGIKLVKIAPVTESMARLGYADHLSRGIGALEMACLAAYLVPRWSVAGAVFLTGFLGGAVATHVRVGDPLGSHVLFPIYVAAMLWAGLWLRDARVRAFVKGEAP